MRADISLWQEIMRSSEIIEELLDIEEATCELWETDKLAVRGLSSLRR